MAAQFDNIFEVELTQGPAIVSLNTMYYGNLAANRIGARVTQDGEAVNLGGSCAGTVIRADGQTVTITGTVSGNICYIDLPANAYAVPGPVQVYVTNTNGSVTTTLVAGFGTVQQTETASVAPGAVPSSVADLVDAIEDAVATIPADYSALWTSLAPAYSTDSSQVYSVGDCCTYNGKVYRCRVKTTAGESFTSGHWTQIDLGSYIASVLGDIGTPYDYTSAYAIGDYCTYQARLYRCNTAIASGGEDWTLSHWTRATVGDVLKALADQEAADNLAAVTRLSALETDTGVLQTQTGIINRVLLLPDTWELKKSISTAGVVSTGNTFALSDYIWVQAGQTLSYTGDKTDGTGSASDDYVCYLAIYDASKTFGSRVQILTNAGVVSGYTFAADGYARIMFGRPSATSVTITDADILHCQIADVGGADRITDLEADTAEIDRKLSGIFEYITGDNLFDPDAPTTYALYIDTASGTLKTATETRLVSVSVSANTDYVIRCGGASHKLLGRVHSTPQSTRQVYAVQEFDGAFETLYNSGSDTFIVLQLFIDSDEDKTASHYYDSIEVRKYLGESAVDTVARDKLEDINVETERSTNLFDPQSITRGYYINTSGGGFVARADHFYELVPISGPGTYRYFNDATLYGTTSALKIVIYDSEGAYKTVVQASHFGETTDSSWYGVEFSITAANIESGYAYIGVCQHEDNLDRLMVVNGAYPETYVPYFPERSVLSGVYLGQGYALGTVPNKLYNKIGLFFGDSICNGSSADDNKAGWAGRIGTANAMAWRNYGQNGAVICTQAGRYSITSQVNGAIAEYSAPDYAILEGGTNDADISGITLGTFTADDYSGTYDTTTFSGALETLIYNVLTNWPHTKFGYIVAQKMGRVAETRAARYTYFERAMDICHKWGVPVLNLWDNTPLNPLLTSMYDTSKTAAENIAAGSMYTDGQHLTPSGYDYLAPIIEEWMRGL